MTDKKLCPTCHSPIATDATHRDQGQELAGESVAIQNPFGDGTVLAKTSTSGAVPQWSDDPVMTKNGLSGSDYTGFDRARKKYITELQLARAAEEIDAGLTGNQLTKFSDISKVSYRFRKTFIIELRQSVEKILDAIGSNLTEYFSTDADGSFQSAGPNDVANKTEWTDVLRGAPYLDAESIERTEFTLPSGVTKASPTTPPGTRGRAILFEDLRHPIVAGWKEFWSITDSKTFCTLPEDHTEPPVHYYDSSTEYGLTHTIKQDHYHVTPLTDVYGNAPLAGYDVCPTDGGVITSVYKIADKPQKTWFAEASNDTGYEHYTQDAQFSMVDTTGMASLEVKPSTQDTAIVLNPNAKTLKLHVNAQAVGSQSSKYFAGLNPVAQLATSSLGIAHQWKYDTLRFPIVTSQGPTDALIFPATVTPDLFKDRNFLIRKDTRFCGIANTVIVHEGTTINPVGLIKLNNTRQQELALGIILGFSIAGISGNLNVNVTLDAPGAANPYFPLDPYITDTNALIREDDPNATFSVNESSGSWGIWARFNRVFSSQLYTLDLNIDKLLTRISQAHPEFPYVPHAKLDEDGNVIENPDATPCWFINLSGKAVAKASASSGSLGVDDETCDITLELDALRLNSKPRES
jgi:hypothetical protein